jgi:predicted nucleic acid-binding Zn ribbon protein
MTETPSEKCVVCAKPIPKGARKCTECGEFQSLISRIMAGMDLKGLLALLPLLTLIYAFLSERIEKQYSDLRIASVTCDAQSVAVFASNAGNRWALLRNGTFAATGDPVSHFDLPTDLGDLTFEPGAARLLKLNVNTRRNPGGLASFQSRQHETCSVALDFDILNFDHTPDHEEAKCVCPSYR